MTRHRYFSASPFEKTIGFCRAIRSGPWVCVSGTGPLDADGKTVAGGAYAQTRRCFEISRNALREFGGDVDTVVRTRMFITDASVAEDVGRAHAEFFGDAPPAATMVVVSGLLDPDWVVETEVDAVFSDDDAS